MQAINPIVYTGLNKPEQAAVRLGLATPDKNRIVAAVCSALDIEYKAIFGKCRTRKLSDARTIAYYLLKNASKMTYTDIGKMFGRDHSSIIYNIHKFNDLSECDAEFKNKVEKVKSQIR